MKPTIRNYTRWLSPCVALFGCVCFVRAAFCAYVFTSFSGAQATRYLASDVVLEMNNVKTAMAVSFMAFTFAGLAAIVSAIGLFLHRSWAGRLWLSVSAALFLYFLLALYSKPFAWSGYLEGLALCLYSCFMLWYLPHKQPEATL